MRLQLLLPPGWASIPLHDTGARRRAIDDVVAVSRLDDGQGARLRRELREQLQDVADSAATSGASTLMLSVQGNPPVPASILVSFLPPSLSVDASQPWLGEGGQVDTAMVRAGSVVRRIRRRDTAMSEDVTLPTLVADYWVTAPDDRLTHVAMSTPLVEHEKAMTDLFDAIMESATWEAPAP
jgi:hypothetical protein